MATEGFNYAPEAAQALMREASRIIRTAALNIERRTKANLQAMVYSGPNRSGYSRTGALLNSIYALTSTNNGYAEAAAQGQAHGKRVLSDAPALVGTLEARVVSAMEYAYFVHDGTRNMPGRPFMLEAAEAERPIFDAAWGRMHLVPGMGGGSY